MLRDPLRPVSISHNDTRRDGSGYGKGRSIIRVSEIIPAPAPTPEQTAALKTELNRQLQTDILAEYIAGLQARYGLSLNQEALKQALGGDRGAEGAGIE